MTRPSSGAASRYKEAARNIFGRAKSAGGSAFGKAKATGARAGSALARASETDTLGGIFARQSPAIIAGGVAGAVDASPWGVALFEKTGKRIKPMTALAIAGGIAHGMRWDRRFLGKHVTRGNSALISAMLPIKAYELAGRATNHLFGKVASATSTPKLSGAEHVESEPVPGEETVS